MHGSVMEWLAVKVDEHHIKSASVLEVGSRDEGGTPRHLFNGPYVGVDMRDGPAVDVVADASALPFESRSFAVVLCLEMLEHDRSFWESLSEMGRVLDRNGLLILTARGIGFPYHGYPLDYWRFTEDGIRQALWLAGTVPIEITADPWQDHPGFFAVGQRDWGVDS